MYKTELKFYYTNGACMGWVPMFQKYIQFPTYEEYKDYMREEGESKCS